MTASFQGSLLDLGAEAHPGPFGALLTRTPLSRGAWVDIRPGWLTGAAELFGRLAEGVPWRAEKRQMYDRVVDVPRLLCFYAEGQPLPDPALDEARAALNAHYEAELGEPLVTAGSACTGTAGTAWPGMATPSGGEAPRTRSSRSSRWGRRGRCCCGRAAAVPRCATSSGTAISS